MHYGLEPGKDYETNILILDGQAYFKSESSIRMLEGLGFPWSMASALRIVPRVVRDKIYEVVARNRLNWFGRRDTCYRPDQDSAGRFLT